MNKKNLLYIPFIFLPLIITLVLLPSIPNIIPTHYGFNGQVNAYGSKYTILLLPIITIIICGFFIPLMLFANEKAKKQQKDNIKIVTVSNICMVVLFNVLTYVFLYTSMTKVENLNTLLINKLPFIIVAIVFVVLGNYMPKAKPGIAVGIRTHATRSDPEIWAKTQRVGGKFLMIFGLIILPIVIFLPYALVTPLFVLGVLVSCICPVIYANKLYKKKFKN
ncbi:MAG: DUF1648 domain-containing protein [Sarcina sp.]